jgi:Flp pilus assembly protein TadD
MRAAQAIEVLKAFEKKDLALKAKAATNLSFLYFLEGDIAQADQFANLAVRNDRYNAKALVNKGNCLNERGEHDRAKELYLEAIGVEADCIEAIYNLGLVNKHMGVLTEALQAFEKLHTIVPNSPEVIFQIANLHDMLGNFRAAAKYFSYLISKARAGAQHPRAVERGAAAMGRPGGAGSSHPPSPARVQVPTDPSALARLGQIMSKDDDETQAFHYHLEVRACVCVCCVVLCCVCVCVCARLVRRRLHRVCAVLCLELDAPRKSGVGGLLCCVSGCCCCCFAMMLMFVHVWGGAVVPVLPRQSRRHLVARRVVRQERALREGDRVL